MTYAPTTKACTIRRPQTNGESAREGRESNRMSNVAILASMNPWRDTVSNNRRKFDTTSIINSRLKKPR